MGTLSGHKVARTIKSYPRNPFVSMKLLASLFVICICVFAAAQTPAPVIDVGSAKYQGITNTTTNISSYLGIRYAASPSGNLRWRAPTSPPVLSGIQQAVTQPRSCFQAGNGLSPTNPLPQPGLAARQATADPEDCLFLNVFFPGNQVPTTKLPVVFWIHGGGYIAGSAASFDGGNLIREAGNGVVAVVIQYRLGVLGFLPGSEVKADGKLNAGLLDQDFALKWVQKHISKFGGDPNRVTIWGESAGAGSVLQHVVARNGRTNPPLFRAAMTSSTFLPSQYLFNDTIPEFLFSEVVSQTGCTGTSNTLACLRQTDASALQTVNANINRAGFFGTFVLVPVVDGEFITQRPTEALRKRQVNGRALLAVTNSHEGNVFVDQSTAPTVMAADYASRLFPGVGMDQAYTITRLYADVGSPIDQANAIMSEAIFLCPSYAMLRAFPGRSFKGEFAVPQGLHGQDVAFYFPSSGTVSFNNPAFITSFSQAFLGFARSLDPNNKFSTTNITPMWSRFILGNTEMVFNRTTSAQPDIHAITTDDALLQRFWESISELTAQ
ncbi:hypothetical protein ONZ45_g17210 [Pleurotus djamor]|nr:hypothetical protein ONZ45_g17210 [Pleurotus djamor]